MQIKSIWRAPKEPLIDMSEDFIITEKPQLKYSNGILCETSSSLSIQRSIQTLDGYAMPVQPPSRNNQIYSRTNYAYESVMTSNNSKRL